MARILIDFVPHSWYKGWSIKQTEKTIRRRNNWGYESTTFTYNAYRVKEGVLQEVKADRLQDLKDNINAYMTERGEQ